MIVDARSWPTYQLQTKAWLAICPDDVIAVCRYRPGGRKGQADIEDLGYFCPTCQRVMDTPVCEDHL